MLCCPDECDDPTSCLVQPIVAHCCEGMYFGCFDFRGVLGFLNCDDIWLLIAFFFVHYLTFPDMF